MSHFEKIEPVTLNRNPQALQIKLLILYEYKWCNW